MHCASLQSHKRNFSLWCMQMRACARVCSGMWLSIRVFVWPDTRTNVSLNSFYSTQVHYIMRASARKCTYVLCIAKQKTCICASLQSHNRKLRTSFHKMYVYDTCICTHMRWYDNVNMCIYAWCNSHKHKICAYVRCYARVIECIYVRWQSYK